MNKRISKKIHKKYIFDIVYHVSISSIWRNWLFNQVADNQLLIDKDNVKGFNEQISRIIKAKNLSYVVCLDKSYIGSEKRFVFQAKNFKEICAESYNNPNVI